MAVWPANGRAKRRALTYTPSLGSIGRLGGMVPLLVQLSLSRTEIGNDKVDYRGEIAAGGLSKSLWLAPWPIGHFRQYFRVLSSASISPGA